MVVVKRRAVRELQNILVVHLELAARHQRADKTHVVDEKADVFDQDLVNHSIIPKKQQYPLFRVFVESTASFQ